MFAASYVEISLQRFVVGGNNKELLLKAKQALVLVHRLVTCILELLKHINMIFITKVRLFLLNFIVSSNAHGHRCSEKFQVQTLKRVTSYITLVAIIIAE